MKKQRLVIIDGSNLWYRCYWVNPYTVNTIALQSYRKVLFDLHASHGVMVFDSKAGDLFRKSIDPMYKSNRRKKSKKEVAMQREFRKLVRIPTVIVKGRDGDDVMYSLAKLSPMPVTIVTADKDLLQCVNENISVYCPLKKQFYRTDEDVMTRKHMEGIRAKDVPAFLALVGDTIDNVHGLKGIGPKKALAIIQSGAIEKHPLVRHRLADFKLMLELTKLWQVKIDLPPLKAMRV